MRTLTPEIEQPTGAPSPATVPATGAPAGPVTVRPAGSVIGEAAELLSLPFRPAGAVTDALVATAAFLGARLRGARLFHPAGRVFRGTLTVPGRPDGYFGAPLLDEEGSYKAVVRLSKGTSTPGGLPDILGLAVRVQDPPGATGRSLDLALFTTATEPVLRQVLPLPRGQFVAAYGSLLPYLIGGRVRLIAALPDVPYRGRSAGLEELEDLVAGPGLRFQLAVATAASDWLPFARLSLHLRRPDEEDPNGDNLCFNPVSNSLPTFRPIGLLQALRGPAYEGSQQGRRASCAPNCDQPTTPRSVGQ